MESMLFILEEASSPSMTATHFQRCIPSSHALMHTWVLHHCCTYWDARWGLVQIGPISAEDRGSSVDEQSVMMIRVNPYAAI